MGVILKLSIFVLILQCVTLIRGEECIYGDSGICEYDVTIIILWYDYGFIIISFDRL